MRHPMAGPRKTTGGGKTAPNRKTNAARGKAGAKTPPVKVVENTPKPDITVVTPAEPVVAEGLVKKVALIDSVVEATGMKRKDVKPVVEATLAEIGNIIGKGADMQIPELGKLMVHKRKELPNGEMVMLKLRRKTVAKPLAEDDDNG
ncbi:HU family DNA-binding protein [Vannielia litorea]|uniref:HU family DNA-binding protein n=1 Tax=Vannielia litorea TaxID=1217970 RepID=UPI001C973202|nr:HU family DNA-binding protein [Vannielia litorea]MBY6047121.1 HU family DNA-binding protein [Vannielia litorea]MBY6074535.1 HU family DNA-binding protein [Vannielia litorea]